MLSDHVDFKNDVVVNIDELNNVSDVIECLIIGNGCLNELKRIHFSRFMNVRMIDVGYDSLGNVESVVISSLMVYD